MANTSSESVLSAGNSNVRRFSRTLSLPSTLPSWFSAKVTVIFVTIKAFLPAQGTSTFVTILTKRVAESSFAFFTSWAYRSHLAGTATLCAYPTGKIAGDVAANRPHYNRDHPGERFPSIIPIFIIDLICHVFNDLDDVTHVA